MTKEMFEEITAWQREIFTKATALSAAIHLKEESFELVEAIENYAPGKRIDHEYADVLLLAFGSASLYGFTYEDVCRIINEKMEINKRRQWGKVNEQGYVKHVDESPSSPSEDKGGEDSVDEKNNEVLDVFKHYTKTDFKSPEVLQQLDLVIAEINEVMMGAKVDPEKMRIILSMNGVGDDFVKQHTPVGFTKYKDFFVAGMITGFLLSNSDKSNL